MAEPESDVISHEPGAVAAQSLIPTKRSAPEDRELMNATSKRHKDSAEAINIQDAAKKLFFPTTQKLSEQELNQLSRIIFGDYLKLKKVPSASLTEEIRQFRLVQGSQVPFRLMHGFQLWLRETGQHASQVGSSSSSLSKKLRKFLQGDSKEDAESNNYSNTGAIDPERARQTSKCIHESNFGLRDWDQQLMQDTADMHTRVCTRICAIENAIVVMRKIEEYTYICSYNGLRQLMKLSGRPTCPQSIRHAYKPEDLNEIMSVTSVDHMYANLIYHSLYEVLQSVDDLSVILAEGLDMLRKMDRFKREIEKSDDPTIIDREGLYTRISVSNGCSGKEVKEIASSVSSAQGQATLRTRALCRQYNSLAGATKRGWDAMHGQNGSREDRLKSDMHDWILYKQRTPAAMIESNTFVSRWETWKALAQKDALSTLVQHHGDLQSSLQMLEKSVG